MRQRLRSRLSYANVIATLALFIALGGGTTAVALNGSNTVQSDDLGPGAQVKAPDIADNAVDGADIARDAVQAPEIAQNGVGKGEIRNDAVGTSKVANGSLTGDDLADSSVNGNKVLDRSLTGADLAGSSVTGFEVSEQSLDTVPVARVGMVGGIGRDTGGVFCNPEGTYIDCAITSINLPTAARVLVIGQVASGLESGVTTGHGDCKLVTNTGDVSGTRLDFFLNSHPDQDASGLTGVTGVLGAGSHDFAVDCEDATGGMEFGQVGITAVALSPF